MRFSPTRIVLASLAFIVGAVLALPMLLSRKVEAGDAPPKLEASTEAAALLGWIADPDHGGVCGAAPADAWSHDVAWPYATGPLPFPDGLSAPTDGLTYEFVAAPPVRPWPAAQVIDRQRKYHLRP